MFYCEPCRVRRGWPEAFSMSRGRCELCDTVANCHDRPSSSLPAPVNPNVTTNIPSERFDKNGVQYKPGGATYDFGPGRQLGDLPEVRQAVRHVLKHHKLTEHGDGVVEADLAHAVLGALPRLPAAEETFAGDNQALRRAIDALLGLDKAGALRPHPLGGHARTLLSVARDRLPALEAPPPPTDPLGFHYAVYSIFLEYFEALYQRQHGGVAQDKAMGKIQSLLGMHYDVYREARAAQEKKS